jgi:hypothetical protein
MYRKGFWLILVEDDGAEMAVACHILSQNEGGMRVCAHIPPSWYPQSFTGFKIRQDGEILGWCRLPAERQIRVPAHAGLHSVDLDFRPNADRSRHAAGAGREAVSVPND